MNMLLSAAILLAANPSAARPVEPPIAVPARPAVDPQRLALARQTVDALFPAGISARLVTDMMSGATLNGMLDMRPSELGMGELGMVDRKEPGGTIRDEMKKKDPHFDRRMAIIGRVVGEEMTRLGPQIETPLRDGLAESVARRFTAAQLTDINGFFASDSGKAFGRELWLLWFDPAVVKGMIGTMPVMLKEMPAVMKKVDAATAHLPKPGSKADPKKK
jgi:hypothetical protein